MNHSNCSAPFVRPVGHGEAIPALPDGWETHPAGAINGDLMEVAFNPARHDVTFVWDRRVASCVAETIVTQGWQPLACTDAAQIWVRDRTIEKAQTTKVPARQQHHAMGVAR